MGVNAMHALGRRQRFYSALEATFGTFVKPVTGDALKVLSSSFEFGQERRDRIDAKQTRSLLERITARKTCSWSMECYCIPSGTGATRPDTDQLLAAAIGKSTVSGSTVVYSLTDNQSGFDIAGTIYPSLTLVREASKTVMEALVGAMPESLKISFAGADEPRFAFEGFAKDHIHTGSTGVVSSRSTTSVTLGSGQGKDYQAGSVVFFEVAATGAVRASNSGAGYKVLTVSTDTLTFTEDVQADGVVATDLCLPFVPTETTTGSPINGISGSLAITAPATSLIITGGEIMVKNSFKQFGDEAFQASISDYIPGRRSVSGSLTVRGRRDQFVELGVRKNFTARDVQIILGTGSGTRFQIDMDAVEMGFSALEIPEADEATFTLPFVALGTGSGENEFTLTHE